MISIWEKETFFAPQDVVIIGSGFVGLWSALYLKKQHPNRKVTILDRGLIPTGASTRNAGFACFGSLTELMFDAQTMGVEKTLELVALRHKGLERIQKYFKKDSIDFDLCGGYELFDAKDGINSSTLSDHIHYVNSLLKGITGTKNTYKLADDKIRGFGFSGITHLVKNNLEGYLHSGKLVKALLQKVQGLGVQVLTGIGVQNLEHGSSHITIHTDKDIRFTATNVLVCTNAFAKELLPDADIIPARGQVLLTSPIPNLPWKGTFHYDEGFYYFRNLGNRVLLGGARNKAFTEEQSHEFVVTPTIQTELERFLAEVLLPQYKNKYTIDHRWSGIMAMGTEKMPIVKEVAPSLFCAVRMSGMGVALAPVVGQQAATLLSA